MVRLHAEWKSKITVSQISSKELTQRRNESLKKRKKILQESPELNNYMEFRACLMAKKKKSETSIKKLKDSKQFPVSM